MTVGNEPWQRVLLKMKEVSGWTTDLPKGHGMGIGIAEDHGSVVGTVASVEVTRTGQPLHRQGAGRRQQRLRAEYPRRRGAVLQWRRMGA